MSSKSCSRVLGLVAAALCVVPSQWPSTGGAQQEEHTGSACPALEQSCHSADLWSETLSLLLSAGCSAHHL